MKLRFCYIFLLLAIFLSHNFCDDDLFATRLGLTGSILTPSPFTREVEEGSLSYTLNTYDIKDQSTKVFDRASNHDISFSAGVMENVEFAITQQYFTGGAKLRNRTLYSLKLAIPSDSIPMAFSFVAPGTRRDYSSALATFGWKSFYIGGGTNFGGRRLTQLSFIDLDSFGTAAFGGYRLQRVLANRNLQPNLVDVEGRPDEVFGFAGGQVNLGKNVQFLFDYNGDIFASGFRLSLDTSTLQLSYVSTGDYDDLFGRKQDNLLASAQYRF
ncbi:MAG: hypothetical protein COB02_09685 [Candidatus Cloacimonadota bacterium]|nr:MAG: hypothetical protein COB02_09685 [Candidatus Cloacimonadota bacterium]